MVSAALMLSLFPLFEILDKQAEVNSIGDFLERPRLMGNGLQVLV